MGNKEYKTLEEVKQRAEEAIGHSFKEIFELAQKFQQKNGLKEKHKETLGKPMKKDGLAMRTMKKRNQILKMQTLN